MKCAIIVLAITLQVALSCPAKGKNYGCGGYVESYYKPYYESGYFVPPPPPPPCEEIVIHEKPNEIRKVVVEEEFLVPVRKPTRPRPLEVVTDDVPTCGPPSYQSGFPGYPYYGYPGGFYGGYPGGFYGGYPGGYYGGFDGYYGGDYGYYGGYGYPYPGPYPGYPCSGKPVTCVCS